MWDPSGDRKSYPQIQRSPISAEARHWHNGWFTYDQLNKSSRLQQVLLSEAQKVVAHVSERPEYMAEARAQAERIITALYAETGYTVSFEWPDVLSDGEPEETTTLSTSSSRGPA